MNFISIRIITDDVKRLAGFYETITGLAATWYSDDFAEIATPAGTLAIASTRTMALFKAGAARPADNHSVIVEFRVGDVDAQFRALADVIEVVQAPTTMPWGNRSLLLRDPDGNLVNVFTPVTAEAIRKFDR
ncbi:glyoxalase/bleomycin resistance protein/dioxygenase superfamily protein [Roseiarcus fermentans]|uniref:Glyoxalase/bleomycin resistance protein/dioxygenase superfamily protein n=1 Tax=Roseiarcus fermentans TaxID=1473586 RepID=A0A366ERT3_9HYPH|nr:VOC family protein [Roseiarcus fermentans]RBP05117.1 glyoxalase/bleomycin resistance protein/dioxygenase superfamily protein [Roseiarcus fermentans]